MTIPPRSERKRARKMGKKFDRVGLRDQRVTNIESHEISDLNKTYCPCCKAGPMDGVTGADIEDVDPYMDDASIRHAGYEEPRKIFPHDGSPTICAYCGELLVFRVVDNALTLAYHTDAELDDLRSDAQKWEIISRLQNKMKQYALEGRLRGDKRYAKSKPRRF